MVKAGSTVGAILLVLIGAYVVNATQRDGSVANVVIMWNPSPREPHGTEVRVAVGGKPAAKGTPTTAPWARSFPLKRGEKIEVWTSLLGHGDAFLGCNITIDGVPEFEKGGPTQPGRVLYCWGIG